MRDAHQSHSSRPADPERPRAVQGRWCSPRRCRSWKNPSFDGAVTCGCRASPAASHTTVSAPCAGAPQQRPEPGKAGQPAGEARRVDPARVGRVAGHAVGAPAARPLVGQDDLGALGPGVRRGPPVMVRRHLEAVEIEALRVHPPRRHGDDVGPARTTQERAEQPRQAERRQHRGGHGELTAVGSAAVGRVQRAGGVHEHVQPLVGGRDPRGERAHGLRIGHVEHHRLGHSAGPQGTGLVRSVLGPAPVAADHPDRRAEPSQLERGLPTDPRGGPRHDRHPAREATRRLPVLEARPCGVARPAEAAHDARLEHRIDQIGRLHSAHARARRNPSAPRSAIFRNDRATRGAARRSTPRLSSTAT